MEIVTKHAKIVTWGTIGSLAVGGWTMITYDVHTAAIITSANVGMVIALAVGAALVQYVIDRIIENDREATWRRF